jgi:hypothetical protein
MSSDDYFTAQRVPQYLPAVLRYLQLRTGACLVL